MGKRGYREWTPTEEARLPHWIGAHPDSEWSWDMRAEEYTRTIRPRTAESLRSKLRQLRKNIRRRRPIRRQQARVAPRGTAKQARKEQQRTREMSPLGTTKVPAPWTHRKDRRIEAGIDQVQGGGRAILAAGASGSPSTTLVDMKSPFRDRALMRPTLGRINTL